MWTPDEQLVSHARDLVDELRAKLEAGESHERDDVLLLCEAAGTLAVCEVSVPPVPASGVRAIERAVAALDGDDLTDAGFELLRSAAQLDSPEHDVRAVAEEQVSDALRARTRVELVARGAGVLTERAPVLGEDLRESIAAFDGAVDACIDRLTRINERRLGAVAWMHPRHRASFPWLSRHATIPSDTLDRLHDVAELVATNPAVRDAFERAVAAAGIVENALRADHARGAAKRSGKIRSLAEFRERRRARRLVESAGSLAAAAASEGIELAPHPSCELTLLDDRLQLDVLEDLRAGATPELRVDERVVTFSAVPGTDQRFVAELGVHADRAATLRLVLPTTGGDREIDVLGALPQE